MERTRKDKGGKMFLSLIPWKPFDVDARSAGSSGTVVCNFGIVSCVPRGMGCRNAGITEPESCGNCYVDSCLVSSCSFAPAFVHAAKPTAGLVFFRPRG